MKKILVFFLIFCSLQSAAQKDTAVIKLEKELEAAASIDAKLYIIEQLAEKTDFENPVDCQAYLDKGILLAEQSRNREMMVKCRRVAASVYLNNGGIKARAEKARAYITEALEICKQQTGIEKEKVLCNNIMARVERTSGKAAEALKYNQESIAIANETDDDSLKIMSLLGLGNTQLVLDENLNGFKTYLQAQTIAEKSRHKNKDWLQIMVYNSFVRFYTKIEDYDKAIDYQYKSLDYAKNNNNTYDILNALLSIGSNYIIAKKYDAAKGTFEEMIKMADSLKEPNYKTQGVIGILNNIINSPEKAKGLDYLKQHPEIKKMIEKLGVAYQLDKGMGDIFHAVNMPDSANYYYEKAIPAMDAKSSIYTRVDAYYNYGYHLYTIGNYNKAITYLLKAKLLNDSAKNISGNLNSLNILDSCYQKTGDYKNAFLYNSLYQKTKAELEEKSKAKDVLALEIDAANKSKERQEKAEAEETQRRHNWQYMGIVLSIATLFILLVALGFFSVPIKWVRALGFISFIFLFEFITLLADNWIHDFTHGEPWKVLAIKVVLIAMLLPLHHFLEEKVIHYIVHRKHKKNQVLQPQEVIS